MAEKRRGKSKKREDEMERPNKEEYAVAKFLRFNVPTKEGKLVGMTVHYFIASKAVDALMESKWAKGKEPIFSSRNSVVDYCNTLLRKGMFHRAARYERKRDKKKPKKIEEDASKEEEKKKKSKKALKEKEESEEKKDTKSEGKPDNIVDDKGDRDDKDKETEKKEDEKKEEEKKKKKKARLEMHDAQVFKDGDEVYVWIYDPVPLKTFIIGLLLVLGAVAVCLFPLWPPEVRLGVYYLSLAAAGFVGLILALCVVRLILFCIVWVLTFGNHHFWFLPNLTEDVGFFDSFKPLYKHDVSKGDDSKDDKDKGEKDEKKDSKDEEAGEEAGGGDAGGDREEGKEELGKEDSGKEQSEKGSGSEQDNDNGYEIVQREEIEEQEQEEQDPEDQEPASPSEKKNQ